MDIKEVYDYIIALGKALEITRTAMKTLYIVDRNKLRQITQDKGIPWSYVVALVKEEE